MKKFVAILAILLSTTIALADVIIYPENRVKNHPSGCCLWSALENLGKVHGIKRMEGLARRRHERSEELIQVESWMVDSNGMIFKALVWQKRGDAPGSENRAVEELNSLKVKYSLQRTGNKNLTLIKNTMKKDLGCMIGIKDYPLEGDMHAVTLTAFKDDIVLFIDNNGNCDEFEVSRKWFDDHWTGFAIVIYPD